MGVDHGGLEKFVAFFIKIKILSFFPYFDINFISKPRFNLKYNVGSQSK
jgi:hypothetical protein